MTEKPRILIISNCHPNEGAARGLARELREFYRLWQYQVREYSFPDMVRVDRQSIFWREALLLPDQLDRRGERERKIGEAARARGWLTVSCHDADLSGFCGITALATVRIDSQKAGIRLNAPWRRVRGDSEVSFPRRGLIEVQRHYFTHESSYSSVETDWSNTNVAQLGYFILSKAGRHHSGPPTNWLYYGDPWRFRQFSGGLLRVRDKLL